MTNFLVGTYSDKIKSFFCYLARIYFFIFGYIQGQNSYFFNIMLKNKKVIHFVNFIKIVAKEKKFWLVFL